MSQPRGGGKPAGRRHQQRPDRRPEQRQPRAQPTIRRWEREPEPKFCRKCGGRMYPADWIWQQYGLCVGWRCSKCKEKVMARSLPFKGLRRRKPDPDEIRDRAQAGGTEAGTEDST